MVIATSRTPAIAVMRPIELRQAGPHQGLAAGDADLADARRRRTGARARTSSSSVEQLLARQPLHALGRHAVAAAQVAAVGHRQAQRAVGPPEAVAQGAPRSSLEGYAPGPGRAHPLGPAGGRLIATAPPRRPARSAPGPGAGGSRRSPRCRWAGRCPRRRSRPPATPRRAERRRGRPRRRDARSGVWPMLVRATRAPWIEPLLAPTTAATPTVGPVERPLAELEVAPPGAAGLRDADLGDDLVLGEGGLEEPVEEVGRGDRAAHRSARGPRSRRRGARQIVGRSDAGSPWASEPPIVPRWRTWRVAHQPGRVGR